MRPCKDIETFVSAPVGQYVCGRSWLAFRGESLGGLIVWKSPSAADSALAVRTLPASLRQAPHAYFIDARRLDDALDPAAFSAVFDEAGPTLERYRGRVTRAAVVLPSGMAAAVVVGFFNLAPPPFEVRFFADPIAALEYLGPAQPHDVLAALDGLQEHVSGTSPLLFRLRALLDHDPAGTTVEAAAHALSLSTRSLQRRLVESRTTFRAELTAARLRKAQRLLAATDAKVTAVALEVGCASSQHLSALFRRMTGESPTAWRASHRAAASA